MTDKILVPLPPISAPEAFMSRSACTLAGSNINFAGLKGKGTPLRLVFSLFALLLPALAQQSSRPVSAPEAGANLPAQAVGFNDLLAVSVYDAPELSRTIRVGTDGYIRLPMLKQRVKADGLYPVDIEAAISAALRQEEILVEPFVTVTIAEYHSRPISVAGAVKMPLVFQAESTISLLEAVARAQGLREDAGREILVSRVQPGPDGKPVTLTRRVSVRGLIDDADPDLNLQLIGGEEIRVPEVSKIYVMGNVKKPGAFPVQDGFDTTIMQMLALAEGLMPFANKQAFIYRREAGGNKNEIPVSLDKIMNRKAPDVTLAANDILYIPDNHGKRIGIAALEKVLMFGTAAGTAMIYAGR
jgi:polysaccharide export outer membrane protein